MVAFAILGVVALYFGLCFFVVRALPTIWARWVAVLVAIYLPFWDVPFGYYAFGSYCIAGAGLRKYSEIEPQTTIYLEGVAVATREETQQLLKEGFRVVELRPSGSGAVEVVRRSVTGVEERTTAKAPSSLFGVRASGGQRLSWGILRDDIEAYRVRTGEVVARYSQFRWRFWLQKLSPPLLGSAGHCPEVGKPFSMRSVIRSGTQ